MNFTVRQDDSNPDFEIRTYENGKVWRTKKYDAIMRDLHKDQMGTMLMAHNIYENPTEEDYIEGVNIDNELNIVFAVKGEGDTKATLESHKGWTAHSMFKDSQFYGTVFFVA